MTTPSPLTDERYQEIFLRLVNTLQLDYTCLKATNAALELDNKRWKVKAEKLAKELENASTVTDSASATADNDNALADSLEAALEENEKLKTALDGEMKRIERATKARKVAREKLAHKTEEYNELVQELLEAREQLDKARAGNTEDSRRIEDAEAELKAAREERAYYKDKLSVAETNREEWTRLNREHQEIRELVMQKDEEIEKLRAELDAAGGDRTEHPAVDLAGVRRHLENARRTFEEEPDKSFRAIKRAQNLLDNITADAEEDEE